MTKCERGIHDEAKDGGDRARERQYRHFDGYVLHFALRFEIAVIRQHRTQHSVERNHKRHQTQSIHAKVPHHDPNDIPIGEDSPARIRETIRVVDVHHTVNIAEDGQNHAKYPLQPNTAVDDPCGIRVHGVTVRGHQPQAIDGEESRFGPIPEKHNHVKRDAARSRWSLFDALDDLGDAVRHDTKPGHVTRRLIQRGQFRFGHSMRQRCSLRCI
mmetsp:Transcript_60724/g.96474  ORF Transcript_60724/g.96474 Transcript_60724/m.96474 type:complete len:214 (+) Transcript_60724:440-1081(+)